MNLRIHSVENKGNLDKECVWIDVTESVADLSYYLICDSTYTENGKISNELRHTYWFPTRSVEKGDWIKLMTKAGKNSKSSNDRRTTTHTLYWGLGRTVWNTDGDCAVLFQLKTWKATKA